MPQTIHHVEPNKTGGWRVKKAGAKRATRHFATKKDAEVFGRQVSFNQKTELVIHRRDGSVQQE